MKTHGGMEIELRALLNLALDGNECSASKPGHFTVGESAPGIHEKGG